MVGPAEILNARILVVDDAAVNVLLLERVLRGAGYTAVTTTTEPREVCALYREHRHDLILLDLLMPGMDGFQVMQGLAEVETEGYLPVLVLTAQPDHLLRALQAGAKDFLTKPFEQVELLTRIHNMLEVRLLLRESRQHALLLEKYDPLTGLPNRALFHELLVRTLERSEERTGSLAVLFVAVNRFAGVNDALGRAVGSGLLRRIGDRLVACVGPMDTVARLDGAAFGLIVTPPGRDARAAGLVARAVLAALRAPLALEKDDIALTASIGIALAPDDAPDADTLMKYAETALHEATEEGRDTYRFYSSEMNERACHSIALENDLRLALERDEFVLHYQPKVRLDTGAWSGVEALIRWERPGQGLVLPNEFIAMLEDTELIVPVGAWVIATACRQIAAWAREGLGSIRVSVNVSGQQIHRPGFVAEVARAIQETGIAPESLDLELTESALMAQTEATVAVLRELKALGVLIAIDDFGTGYSSLAYLKRFPIDTLKIDISFIRDLATNPDGAAITAAIINLARSLKLTVVAEGVETEPQLAFLRQHACDEIQGFYFSRPLRATDLATLRGAHPTGTPRYAAASAG